MFSPSQHISLHPLHIIVNNALICSGNLNMKITFKTGEYSIKSIITLLVFKEIMFGIKIAPPDIISAT